MSRRQFQPYQTPSVDQRPSVRDRIIGAAETLFSRSGLRAVSIPEVAALAETNSGAVIRYFESKDGLVLHYLEESRKHEGTFWTEMQHDYPGDSVRQLRAWIGARAGAATDVRPQVCALTNAAIEYAALRHHPVRMLVRQHKQAERAEVARLCREAGYSDPEALAGKLLMLAEGGEIAAMTMGPDGPGIHFVAAAEALIASHNNQASGSNSVSKGASS
jgi:AcrR family transcriptional regulator